MLKQSFIFTKKYNTRSKTNLQQETYSDKLGSDKTVLY
jgi:hypothetical protein